MAPEMLTLAILTVAALVLTVAMIGDRAGWRYPVPRLRLSGRWMNLIWVLLVLGASVQVFTILQSQ